MSILKQVKDILKSNNGWENQTRRDNGQFGEKKESLVALPTTSPESKGAASTQGLHHNNISFLDNPQELFDVKQKISSLAERLKHNDYTPEQYLESLKNCFNADNLDNTAYAIRTFENEIGKLRISDHKIVIKNRQSKKTQNTSIVIQLNKHRGRGGKARVVEYVYNPESLTKDCQEDILSGISEWINTGVFTGTKYTVTKSYFFEEESIIKSFSYEKPNTLLSQIKTILKRN